MIIAQGKQTLVRMQQKDQMLKLELDSCCGSRTPKELLALGLTLCIVRACPGGEDGTSNDRVSREGGNYVGGPAGGAGSILVKFIPAGIAPDGRAQFVVPAKFSNAKPGRYEYELKNKHKVHQRGALLVECPGVGFSADGAMAVTAEGINPDGEFEGECEDE